MDKTLTTFISRHRFTSRPRYGHHTRRTRQRRVPHTRQSSFRIKMNRRHHGRPRTNRIRNFPNFKTSRLHQNFRQNSHRRRGGRVARQPQGITSHNPTQPRLQIRLPMTMSRRHIRRVQGNGHRASGAPLPRRQFTRQQKRRRNRYQNRGHHGGRRGQDPHHHPSNTTHNFRRIKVRRRSHTNRRRRRRKRRTRRQPTIVAEGYNVRSGTPGRKPATIDEQRRFTHHVC